MKKKTNYKYGEKTNFLESKLDSTKWQNRTATIACPLVENKRPEKKNIYQARLCFLIINLTNFDINLNI